MYEVTPTTTIVNSKKDGLPSKINNLDSVNCDFFAYFAIEDIVEENKQKGQGVIDDYFNVLMIGQTQLS
jgi:hypothetical protein